MEQSRFQSELSYLVCLSYLRKLYEKGLMTEPEFSTAREILLKKHKPSLGSLLTEKP